MNCCYRPLFCASLVAALFLPACSVGPNYVRPETEIPLAYKEMEGWKPAEPRDHLPRGGWWQLFNDPELDALEAHVNISNQNVAAAEAQFRQALAQVKIARSGYFPTVTAGASWTRSSGSTTIGSGPSSPRVTVSDYLLSGRFTWEIDVWGRIRRLVEANAANAQASAADLESIRLSAQALLAQGYYQLRGLDAQKRLLNETVAAYQRTLKITKNQYNRGIASRGDVALAETQLETTQAQAIDVGVQRAQLEHAIAVLIGKPASLFSIPPSPLTASVPPIPVGLPSDLLERRPDVAAAERAMAAANAQIGVAVAAFFPAITLSGSGGFESTDLSKWLTWPSRFWSVGPALSQIAYEGGLRRAQTEQARAAYDAGVAFYRQAVLTAFQQVEDNLAALHILEQEARAQDRAVNAAARSLSQALSQYKIGTVSYLNVVTAQAALLANQMTALDILYRRMAAAVLLIQALGGGWSIQDLGEAPPG